MRLMWPLLFQHISVQCGTLLSWDLAVPVLVASLGDDIDAALGRVAKAATGLMLYLKSL